MNCKTCGEIKNKDKYLNCFNCSSKKLPKYKNRIIGICFNRQCGVICKDDYLYCWDCVERQRLNKRMNEIDEEQKKQLNRIKQQEKQQVQKVNYDSEED